MTPKSNLHTHTSFCDGRNTAEEMAQAAVRLGYESLGFSSHAYTPCEAQYSIKKDEMAAYAAEVLRLREKFRGQIDIFLGVEQDIFSPEPPFSCDYKIGSVHYLLCGSEYRAVDDTPEIARETIDKYFGGDSYKYAEAYFEAAARAAETTGCDIVGHFDLLTKFNEDGSFFDETNERYRAAALAALEHEVKTCPLFEINTGAIYRGRRSVPYPAAFLLKALKAFGGEIIITSDSHDAKSLGYRFEEAAALAKECGYKYSKILRKNGFENILL